MSIIQTETAIRPIADEAVDNAKSVDSVRYAFWTDLPYEAFSKDALRPHLSDVNLSYMETLTSLPEYSRKIKNPLLANRFIEFVQWAGGDRFLKIASSENGVRTELLFSPANLVSQNWRAEHPSIFAR